ncbi:hypothetical protein TALC_01034 [Thermoplasmatales archaeon BRNA1]|nr:hypothetical protein TALC_01034 [Thermoplasmatales archaeon BRNA1]
MSDPIFVVESISDGADGHPYDEILSIGVCKVDLDAGDFESVYHATVGLEPKYIGKAKLDYAESKGFNVSELYDGIPIDRMVREFKDIIRGGYVTSYDIRQQFNKYLINAPWDVTLEAHILPSIMTRQPISYKCKYPEDEPDTIVKAYRKTFRRQDPANVGKGRGALELAQMASMLMIGLHERGRY